MSASAERVLHISFAADPFLVIFSPSLALISLFRFGEEIPSPDATQPSLSSQHDVVPFLVIFSIRSVLFCFISVTENWKRRSNRSRLYRNTGQ
ncbi:hypothetical protein CKAN_02642000 [Cinnamomum micranthum f. kanehirae]|uniref:Uncharacterized protein n=1 Tax=Cinnamomum micranthum f. kanehirae TaxID=337451 RepID=A0A3S3N6X9_9MAGN|nr:hypothetical protein CKAN_02642000 [Cinnamomum micranthum f. kanehirae]